jgi:hypothetical protein
MPAVKGHLHYARHFTVLLCISGLLIVIGPARLAAGPQSAFALYGALHASAVAVSVRARQPLRRQMLFISTAALLSMLTADLGLYGARFIGTLPWLSGPSVPLILASAIGAIAYGTLISKLKVHDFKLSALATAALVCALTTFLAFIAGSHYQVLGGLWLAIPWWLAFSVCLWYYDVFQGTWRGGHGP